MEITIETWEHSDEVFGIRMVNKVEWRKQMEGKQT